MAIPVRVEGVLIRRIRDLAVAAVCWAIVFAGTPAAAQKSADLLDPQTRAAVVAVQMVAKSGNMADFRRVFSVAIMANPGIAALLAAAAVAANPEAAGDMIRESVTSAIAMGRTGLAPAGAVLEDIMSGAIKGAMQSSEDATVDAMVGEIVAGAVRGTVESGADGATIAAAVKTVSRAAAGAAILGAKGDTGTAARVVAAATAGATRGAMEAMGDNAEGAKALVRMVLGGTVEAVRNAAAADAAATGIVVQAAIDGAAAAAREASKSAPEAAAAVIQATEATAASQGTAPAAGPPETYTRAMVLLPCTRVTLLLMFWMAWVTSMPWMVRSALPARVNSRG